MVFKDPNFTLFMQINRIVSFLPSGTELIYEMGCQDLLCAVTHECKFPIDARNKPIVINSVIDSKNLTSNEINHKTCELLSKGKEIFQLNEKVLVNSKPDLIISQETCEVCAAYTNQVNKAIQILQNKPQIFSMDPHSLEEILQTVEDFGKILNKEERAKQIQENLRKRISKVKSSPKGESVSVLAIEWLDPFFTAGHWIPEMVELAGGVNLISQNGEHSRRMSFEEVSNSDPDVIILMPCGFDVNRTVLEYNQCLKNNPEWKNLRAVKNKKIFAVDANSYFSKPSIRTITGLEIIAKIVNPQNQSQLKVPENSFLQI